ncbi:ABC-three component system protein [Sorangium sp. So ce134]
MIEKLRLTWHDDYAYAFATKHAAEMLMAWLDRRAGPRLIACEHFAIDGWDDVVVEKHDGTRVHYQVKHQYTDFDTVTVRRPQTPQGIDTKRNYHGDGLHDAKIATKSVVTPTNQRKLFEPTIERVPQAKPASTDTSILDKAFQKIAAASRDPQWDGFIASRRRRFALAVPANVPKIKKDLTLAHLTEFIERCHKEGQVAEWMGKADDGPTRTCISWLTTSCGFEDTRHILRALPHVDILTIGTRIDLEAQTDDKLQPLFTQPTEARRAIYEFLKRNADGTQATTPRLLLPCVLQYLNETYRRWVLYRHDAQQPAWWIAGTIGLRGPHPVSVAEIVETLWTPSGKAQRQLYIAAQHENACSLRRSLLRLATHAEIAQTEVHLTEHSEWKIRVLDWVGGTLGVESNDKIGVNWRAYSDDPLTVACEPLPGDEATDEVAAQALTARMDAHTWAALVKAVNGKISEYGGTELKKTMVEVWKRWRADALSEPHQQAELMRQLLQANGERRNQSLPAMRVGPRTIELMAKGVLLNLALVAVLDPKDGTWNKINGKDTHTIALHRCSDLDDSSKEGKEVTSQAQTLLSRESASIVLLSGTDASPDDLLPDSLADDDATSTRIGHATFPEVVFTMSVFLRARYDIDKVRKNIEARRERYSAACRALIEKDLTEAARARV